MRKVDLATGIVTLFAGTGANSFTGNGGPATSASIQGRLYVSGDLDGNMFIGGDVNRLHRVDGMTNNILWVAGKCVCFH